jgi:L-2-amino-thiazoline-4-carboxylic acid hydrolase
MCEFRFFGMDKGKIDLKIQNKAQTLPFANPVRAGDQRWEVQCLIERKFRPRCWFRCCAPSEKSWAWSAPIGSLGKDLKNGVPSSSGSWLRSLPAEASNSERFAVSLQAIKPDIGDGIDFKWLQGESVLEGKTNERIEFDITGCRFAQLFRALGEPELGFALLCAGDNTLTDEVGKGDVEFKRTQTIMQGADHCDFRFALKKKGLV